MNQDMTFCGNDECLHRRGCERYVAKTMIRTPDYRYFLADPQKDCVESEISPYQFLIRYQNNDADKEL